MTATTLICSPSDSGVRAGSAAVASGVPASRSTLSCRADRFSRSARISSRMVATMKAIAIRTRNPAVCHSRSADIRAVNCQISLVT